MPMTDAEAKSRQLFSELNAGDRIEVVHTIIVGNKRWNTTTEGTVVRTERRKHGLHFRRNPDDKVFSDIIIMRLDDGELTTMTMDEITEIRKLSAGSSPQQKVH